MKDICSGYHSYGKSPPTTLNWTKLQSCHFLANLSNFRQVSQNALANLTKTIWTSYLI